MYDHQCSFAVISVMDYIYIYIFCRAIVISHSGICHKWGRLIEEDSASSDPLRWCLSRCRHRPRRLEYCVQFVQSRHPVTGTNYLNTKNNIWTHESHITGHMSIVSLDIWASYRWTYESHIAERWKLVRKVHKKCTFLLQGVVTKQSIKIQKCVFYLSEYLM